MLFGCSSKLFGILTVSSFPGQIIFAKSAESNESNGKTAPANYEYFIFVLWIVCFFFMKKRVVCTKNELMSTHYVRRKYRSSFSCSDPLFKSNLSRNEVKIIYSIHTRMMHDQFFFFFQYIPIISTRSRIS